VDKLEDQNDANFDLRDEDDETPYTLAIRNNHPEIFKMLIEKVDNANPEVTQGMWPFTYNSTCILHHTSFHNVTLWNIFTKLVKKSVFRAAKKIVEKTRVCRKL
jgi:ankyrin repeat protein